MKNSKSGQSSISVVSGSERSLKLSLKNIIIIALTSVMILAISYSIYSSKVPNSLTYLEVLDTSKQLIAGKKYNEAYNLLEDNKDKDALENNIEFYVLISKSAYLSGNKNQAKKYATKASELYKKSTIKNPEYGYILQSILSDTYVVNPYERNKGETQQVPKEQVEDPDFQG